MSPSPSELSALREAVMQVSDPKPGRHLGAILVASVWILDTDPMDGVIDLVGSPPDGMLGLIGEIKRLPFPEAS